MLPQLTGNIPADIEKLRKKEDAQRKRGEDAQRRHNDAGTWGIVKCVFFPPMIPWFLADMEREQKEASQAMQGM